MEHEKVELNFSLHPRQIEALLTEATDLLFGGASRGGKSYFVRVALITLCTWVDGLQTFIFRKYYDDVIGNHMESPDGFRAMLAPYVDRKIVRITESEIRWLKTGSLISLEHCATDEALQKHQGREKHVLVLEEATQIKERYIRWLRGWVSMSKDMKAKLPDELKGKLPRIIQTANPIGISAPYYRRQFVKCRPPFKIEEADAKEGGFKRQYIPARIDDNPSEDKAAAIARLSGLGDEAISDALITGNWDSPVGDYFKIYNDELHTTPNFMPPDYWFKFVTFDWGGYEPFCVLWWCVSDGIEFVDDSGRRRWFPRGSLIAYREWYGCDPLDPARGLEMRNEDIAKGIIERIIEPWSGVIITDNLPFQDRGMSKDGKKYRIADVFKENGAPLIQGNCARITGWSQMRDRLKGKDGIPMLFLCECCGYTRDYIPALGRSKTNPEDAEESGEATHSCDCVRLACTARPLVKDQKPTTSDSRPKNAILTPAEILKQLRRSQR